MKNEHEHEHECQHGTTCINSTIENEPKSKPGSKHGPFELCNCRPPGIIYHCAVERQPKPHPTSRMLAVDFIEANIRSLSDDQILSIQMDVEGYLRAEPEKENRFIRMPTGFEAWDILNNKACHFCQHPRSEHREHGNTYTQGKLPCSHTDIDPEDEAEVPCLCYGFTTSKEESEALAAETSPNPVCACGHILKLHTNVSEVRCQGSEIGVLSSYDGLEQCGCRAFVETEKLYDASNLAKSRADLAERFKLYKEAYPRDCVNCGHTKGCHESTRIVGRQNAYCNCSDVTTVSQFSSCSQWVPPEHSSQSPEPQSPDHSLSRSQRVRIADDPAVHRESIQESNPPVMPAGETEQLSLLLLARLMSLAAECPACRKSAAQALNNLLLALRNCHHKHTEH